METVFEYYEGTGLLKELQDSRGKTKKWTYTQTTPKRVVEFHETLRVPRPEEAEAKFEYDAHGMLIKASSEKVGSVQLVYDSNERLSIAADSLGDRLALRYDDNGQLIEISQEGIGSFHMSNNGEADKDIQTDGPAYTKKKHFLRFQSILVRILRMATPNVE